MPVKPSERSTLTSLVMVLPYVPPSPNRTQGSLRAHLKAKRDAKAVVAATVPSSSDHLRRLCAWYSLRLSIALGTTTTSPPPISTSGTPSPINSPATGLPPESPTNLSTGSITSTQPADPNAPLS